MRYNVLIAAAALVLLAGCRGQDMSQANNSSANLSPDASPPATGAGSATTNTAAAQAPLSKADAAKVMHERHEGMETIGKATKAAGRELKGSAPDLGVVRKSAAQIADLSRKSADWFPAGTGPDVGKTGAKPAIWQHPQDFAAKRNSFEQAAGAFAAAAAGTDTAATKTAFASLGKTCKACHDSYRSEMKH